MHPAIAAAVAAVAVEEEKEAECIHVSQSSKLNTACRRIRHAKDWFSSPPLSRRSALLDPHRSRCVSFRHNVYGVTRS